MSVLCSRGTASSIQAPTLFEWNCTILRSTVATEREGVCSGVGEVPVVEGRMSQVDGSVGDNSERGFLQQRLASRTQSRVNC